MKIDTSDVRRSMARLAAATGKLKSEIVKTAAKGFVKDIVSISPPASKGSTGLDARKAGEGSILSDVFGGKTQGLFLVSDVDPNEVSGGYVAQFNAQNGKPILRKKQPGEEDFARVWTAKDGRVYGVEKQLFRPNASLAEMLAHIARYRSKSTGRVSRAGTRDKVIGRHVFIDKMVISETAKAQLLKHLFSHVGILASGWNAAAEKLGVKLPAWVRRHGTRFGSMSVTATATRFRAELSNDVEFIGDVRGYDRRIAAAFRYQVNKMDRQADYLQKKAIRQAGFP
jgi:hypothetical protein